MFGPRKEGAWALVAAWVVSIVLVIAVGAIVVQRRGNLGWDDADYLRRGLRLARLAEADGWLRPDKAIDHLLREAPKPPLFVAWVEAVALNVGRRELPAVLVGATAVPFGLLLLSTAVVARRLFDDRAALIAVVALAASPMCLSYGAKVMVETLLATCIVWSLFLAAIALERPTTRRGVLLGTALGLAALTKLTVVMLLAAPSLDCLVRLLRRDRESRPGRGFWVGAILSMLIVAGPWYAKNGRETVEFARRVSDYPRLAGNPAGSVPIGARMPALGKDLAGWPVLVVAAIAAVRSRRNDTTPGRDAASHFVRLALLGAAGGGLVLSRTPAFDPRFLLPIWPALAVSLGGRVSGVLAKANIAARVALPAMLVLGLATSIHSLTHEETTTTYWAASRLVDDLVASHGVRNVASLGTYRDWNVCKTGLANELRDDPSGCFVLHDLSRDPPEVLRRRVERLDAIMVLDPHAVPREHLAQAPAFNRAYASLGAIASDPRFERVETDRGAGLPPISIYVRKDLKTTIR